MGEKNVQLIIAALVVVVISVATGTIVHYNDKTANDHAMMESTKMQNSALQKAASDAAMKQSETDKMAANDAMMHTNQAATTTTGQ